MNLSNPFALSARAAKFGLEFDAAVACGSGILRTLNNCISLGIYVLENAMNVHSVCVRYLRKHVDPHTNLLSANCQALQSIADDDRHAAEAGILESSPGEKRVPKAFVTPELCPLVFQECFQRQGLLSAVKIASP